MKIGDGIVVCPLCYVEGRGCNCGAMNPIQCRPFGDLLRVRDEALHAIRAVCPDVAKDYECLLGHSNSIISTRHVGIFVAACVLYERRQMSSDMEEQLRMCLSKHEVPQSAIIYCPLCHVGRCTTHILEGYHIHSAPALLMSDDAKVWHSYHKESKAAFREGYARVQHDEETGARPDFRLKLAYVASKFRTCKSVNPNATTPGWYDKCIELTSASVASSPLKQTTNSSGSEVTFTRPEKSSLSTASLFRSSAAGVFSVRESLPATRKLLGVPLANGKKRSMFDDTTTQIGSLPNEDRTSPRLGAHPRTQTRDVDEEYEQLDASAGGSNGRPPKKQRVGPPSNGLSRKEPMRIEKYSHNPAKKAAGSQAVSNNVQSGLQKQLRQALAENEKLRVVNAKLEKDNEILEDKMCTIQRRNVELMTMAKSFRAQSRKTRDSLDALGQGPVNHPFASAPPIHRHQEGRGSLTGVRSCTAVPPTQPRFLTRPMDRSSSTIIGTQTQETGHSFRIEHQSAGRRHLPIQNMPHHELEMEGPCMDTTQQSYAPSE